MTGFTIRTQTRRTGSYSLDSPTRRKLADRRKLMTAAEQEAEWKAKRGRA